MSKWLEIDRDNLHMKFSALNVDFSNSRPDSVGSSRSAHAGVKQKYPSKNSYLFAVGLSSMKVIADRQRYVAYHNKHALVTSGL